MFQSIYGEIKKIKKMKRGWKENSNIEKKTYIYIFENYFFSEICVHELYWKEKKTAYFDFQNVGFITSTNFVLLTAIYTHLYWQ